MNKRLFIPGGTTWDRRPRGLWMNPRSPGDLVGAGWSTLCMARTLDVFSRTDEITRAICGLLHTGGIEAVTVRAIAEAVGFDLWNATVWLAWCELARHADGPGQAVAEAHLHEVWQLRQDLGDADAALAAHALLRGLRESLVARGEHAMTLETAQRLWTSHLASARGATGGPEAA